MYSITIQTQYMYCTFELAGVTDVDAAQESISNIQYHHTNTVYVLYVCAGVTPTGSQTWRSVASLSVYCAPRTHTPLSEAVVCAWACHSDPGIASQ
jgi:hypothetical protein